jgi:transketolase
MTEKLFVYGPLGIFCAILIVAVIYMYRALDEERKARDAQAVVFDNQIAAMNDKHQKAMETFQERYITKAETWMKQYYDLADAGEENQRANREMFEQFMQHMQGKAPQLQTRRPTGGSGG